jgi:hypothetical protein
MAMESQMPRRVPPFRVSRSIMVQFRKWFVQNFGYTRSPLPRATEGSPVIRFLEMMKLGLNIAETL